MEGVVPGAGAFDNEQVKVWIVRHRTVIAHSTLHPPPFAFAPRCPHRAPPSPPQHKRARTCAVHARIHTRGTPTLKLTRHTHAPWPHFPQPGRRSAFPRTRAQARGQLRGRSAALPPLLLPLRRRRRRRRCLRMEVRRRCHRVVTSLARDAAGQRNAESLDWRGARRRSANHSKRAARLARRGLPPLLARPHAAREQRTSAFRGVGRLRATIQVCRRGAEPAHHCLQTPRRDDSTLLAAQGSLAGRQPPR